MSLWSNRTLRIGQKSRTDDLLSCTLLFTPPSFDLLSCTLLLPLLTFFLVFLSLLIPVMFCFFWYFSLLSSLPLLFPSLHAKQYCITYIVTSRLRTNSYFVSGLSFVSKAGKYAGRRQGVRQTGIQRSQTGSEAK